MTKYTEVQLRPPTFWEWNERQKYFQEVDPVTGAIISVAFDLDHMNRVAEFVDVNIDGQIVKVQSGTRSANLKLERKFPYSPALADVVCEKIMQGTAYTDIPAIKGMPTLQCLNLWRRTNAEFNEKILSARKIRAEKLRDEAVALARESVGLDKDEVPGRKLAIDTMKWAASVDDPEVYGNKVKVEGGVSIEMRLETGIRRLEDPGAPDIKPAISVTPAIEAPKLTDYEVDDSKSKIEEGDDEPSAD